MNANLLIRSGIVIAALVLVVLMAAPIVVASDEPSGTPVPLQKELKIEKPQVSPTKPVVALGIEPMKEGEDVMIVLERIVNAQEPTKFTPEMWEQLRLQDEKSALSF